MSLYINVVDINLNDCLLRGVIKKPRNHDIQTSAAEPKGPKLTPNPTPETVKQPTPSTMAHTGGKQATAEDEDSEEISGTEGSVVALKNHKRLTAE